MGSYTNFWLRSLLVYLAESVKHWGPLWANFAFLFENANGMLLRSFSGTRGVFTRIFKQFLSTSCLGHLEEKHFDGSSDSIVTCYQQLTDKTFRCKSAVMLGDKLFAVGFHRQSILTVQETVAIEDLQECKAMFENLKFYSRFIFKSCIFHTCDYSEKYKNRDSYINPLDRKGCFQISSLLSVVVAPWRRTVKKMYLSAKCFLFTACY